MMAAVVQHSWMEPDGGRLVYCPGLGIGEEVVSQAMVMATGSCGPEKQLCQGLAVMMKRFILRFKD